MRLYMISADNQNSDCMSWNRPALVEAIKEIQKNMVKINHRTVNSYTIIKLAENVRELASIIEIVIQELVHS